MLIVYSNYFRQYSSNSIYFYFKV